MDILIIEDEMLLASELEEKLLGINSAFRIVGKLPSVQDSLAWLKKYSCDLIFMDIQLSDGLSFSIFEKIKISCPVIFTTAYDRYAIQAFDVNSIAYILKPIDEEEIRKALEKYYFLRKAYLEKLQKFASEMSTDNKKYSEQLIVSQGPVKKILKTRDIPIFKADDRYVFAFSAQGQRFFCNHTLKELETILNPHLFFRISRTYIIQKEHIMGWTICSKGRIEVSMNVDTPFHLFVSQSRTSEFKAWLKN